MIALHHQIFEDGSDDPILEHIFYGETPEECSKLLEVHARFDEFLRAALTTKDFHGIKLRTREAWSRV